MTERCEDCGWECHECHEPIESKMQVVDGYIYHPECLEEAEVERHART